jgi:hypothetical protein
VIDAPFCGARIPVQFSVDRFPVGSDTFVVNLMPEHLTSRDFSVVPGRHAIGARVPGGYVWPDTVVTLAAGETFLDSLPFYCS